MTTTTDMKITALAPWFGSKRTLAPRIVEQLGPHRCYWEPFCGSMAVLLAKAEVSQETVSDLHHDLINMARCIKHPEHGPWLYRALRRSFVSEKEFRECSKHVKVPQSPLDGDALDPQRAYWFFYCSWLGRNGVIGTKEWNNNFCVRYTSNGGIQGVRFAAAVESIPQWRKRMREVTILEKDGFMLLEKIEDQPATAIYCDPPYLQKGAQYLHDFEPEEHGKLAELLQRFHKARVVVSYYDDPRLDELYPGWTKIDCALSKSLSVQGKRGSTNKQAPEVLLVNGPDYSIKEGRLF